MCNLYSLESLANPIHYQTYILNDILASITYVPDRHRDIYAMMRSYLSDETYAADKEKS